MTSFVATVPDSVAAASEDLASVSSELRQAAAAAMAPTTGLLPAAGDEVSTAIAQLFANYGNEFQALNAEASLFHADFVDLLSGSGAAYLAAEFANARPGLLGGLGGSGVAAGAPPGAGPWQVLFSNTGTNLGILAEVWTAHPFPLLRQALANQEGYLELVGGAFVNAATSFPGGLQVLPGQFEAAVQSVSGFNPLAFAKWFGGNQGAYGQLLSSSLAATFRDFSTTIPVFEADLGAAFQQLEVGNFDQAAYYTGKSVLDLLITGFDTSNLTLNLTNFSALASGPIYLEGPAGDLLPILAIPGMELQDLTAILPPGSTVQHMAQHLTNLFNTATSAGISTTAGLNLDTSNLPLSLLNSSFAFNAYFGLPLALGFALIGSPVTTISGLATAATQLGAAVQTGDFIGAANVIVDAPAEIMNDFLNGEVLVDLPLPVAETFSLGFLGFQLATFGFSAPVVVHLPFDGILVPPHPVTATLAGVDLGGSVAGIPFGTNVPLNLTFDIGGTEFGGLVPALVNTLPQALADSITPAA